MKKKLWITMMIAVMSLAGAAMGQYVLTTAEGQGGDGGVSNDTNQQDTYIGGTAAGPALRRYDGVRAKAVILRFDMRAVGGDTSGAILSLTTGSSPGNRGRTINVYHLTDDSLDNWDEATLSYNTAPGLTNPENDGYLTMDPAKWTLVGTINFAATPATNTALISSFSDPNFLSNDKNGLVTMLLYTSISDSAQSWYVNNKEAGTNIPTITFPNARCAINPVPAIGSSVTQNINQLCWTNTEPNNPSGVITCDVYLGTNEPNLLAPNYNLTKIATGVTGTCVTIPPAMLPLPAVKHYWIVDSHDSSSIPAFLGTGADWTFTVITLPVITTQPVSLTRYLGETAVFTVGTDSYSTPNFVWYRSVDNANNTAADDQAVGINSPTLTLTPLVGADEGYYYCVVTNNGGQAVSNTASLKIPRQVAHWTLDTASYIGGKYLDSSADGHHADPNGVDPAAFVNGVNPPLAGQGVQMNVKSVATAGTWNPAYLSNQFTVSFWFKWDGTGGTAFRGLLNKHDGFAAAETLFQIGLNTSQRLVVLRSGGTTISGDVMPANKWVFAAVTYDGTTARIYTYVTDSGAINFSQASGAYTLGTKTSAKVNIGCSYINTSGAIVELFPGIMDDIQIFNYVKDAYAIADLYNQALAGNFCLNSYGLTGFDLDADNNCRLELADFTEFAKTWMNCGLYPATSCP